MTRSPEEMVRLALDLDVAGNFAFEPRIIVEAGGASVGASFCNCYVAVFTAALGCPVPAEMKAHRQISWLASHDGLAMGWMQVDKETARQRAATGFPTIAAWQNPASSGHSHIAMVVPPPDGDASHMYVSAAGRENFVRARLEESFGVVAPMLWFSHD